MNYISPIRLQNTLSKALDLRLNQNAEIGYFDQVVLSPNEIYYQITNSDVNIVFNGNYKVYVADLCGNNLLEITEKVFIEEQTDSKGIRQIGFEIVNIGEDFYFEELLLKFVNNLNGQTWYSNPLIITDEAKSTRFEYTSVNTFAGFEYPKFTAKMQSIRLNCRFNTLSNEITGSEYTNEIGNKVSSVSIMTDLESYIFDKLDNYTYRTLAYILNHPIKYLNGNRVTNSVLPKDIEIIGSSNFGASDFKVAMNYNEVYNSTLQVAEHLELLNITPLGAYTIDSIPQFITLTFNHNISLQTGSIILFSGNSGILETFTTASITDNILSIDITGMITEIDVYKIIVSDGFITSDFGTFEGGIYDFNLAVAEFDSTEFNNDFLI
jgi:methionine-rich copper-binding protein CopC